MQAPLVHLQHQPTHTLQSILNPDTHSLTLTLTLPSPTSKKPLKKYQQSFTNDTLSQQLQIRLNDIENIFECIKDKDLREIDAEKGTIVIVTRVVLRNKTIQHRTWIHLKEVEIGEDQVELGQSYAINLKIGELEKRVEFLEKENKNLNQIIHQYNERMMEMQKLIEQKLKKSEAKMRKQMHQLNQKKNPSQMKHKQQNQEMLPKKKQELKQNPQSSTLLQDHSKQQIYSDIELVKKESLHQISELKAYFTEKLEKIESVQQNETIQLILEKYEDLSEQLQLLKYQTVFTPLETQFSSDFIIKGTYVRYNGEDQSWCQIILDQEQNVSYKMIILKIQRTFNSRIRIGLVDPNTQMKRRSSLNSKDAYCIEGSQGRIYGIEGEKGFTFKQGQTIQMFYNSQQIRYWNMTTDISKNYRYKKSQKDAKLLPFIEMFDRSDCVQFYYW